MLAMVGPYSLDLTTYLIGRRDATQASSTHIMKAQGWQHSHLKVDCERYRLFAQHDWGLPEAETDKEKEDDATSS